MANTGRTLGDLRSLRRTAGLTIYQAAKACGCDFTMISRYEAAETRLPARIVAPMAAAYGTTVTQVLAANERDWLRHDGDTPAPKRRAPRKQVSA